MTSKSSSRGDYICRVRYRNQLPSIPFPPKLLTSQPLVARNAQYTTNSLIEQTPHLLNLDSSSGIPFDKLLVDYLDMMETNPDVVRMNANVSDVDKLLMTPPRDEKELNKQGRKPNVTWLRRSEYIASTERKQKQANVPEIRSKLSQQDMEAHTYRTHQSQMEGVDATFIRHDLTTLRHPRTKKRAKKLTPILPDMTCWENVYTIGQFPSDPADNHRLNKRQRLDASSKQPSELDAADRGILRPISNPHDPNDSYLIWFLPDEDSSNVLKQQKTDPQQVLDKPLNFEAVRDYTYRNDNAPGHQNLLLVLQHDEQQQPVMLYSLVKSKLVAQKKRALAPQYRYMNDYEKPNVLSVTYQ
ncbi:RNA polymerase II-associated [Halteromyces radiatus]|uniref:RNA polymerase II-associated n=1 Tax=Halteromyces radiatus TaxID=101107 RepID=UPI00221F9A60|nr:RNA polymerase II-associated [Halteromyces radiatus]KAI8099410.1 RNA polymerase II-associated [Halteromyces radiatus]